MAKVVEAKDPSAAWSTMTTRSLVSVGIIGLLVGVVTYALYLVLLNYVFEPIMCREGATLARCESRGSFASAVAIILGSMVGLVFLVRERAYRPLLVILAIGLAMWGLFTIIATMPWMLGAIVVALAFAVGYMLFAWLVQPASLLLALVFATVAIVAVRLVLTS